MLLAQIENWMLFAGVALMVVILLRRYRRYFAQLKREQRRSKKPSAPDLRRDGVPGSPLIDAPVEALRWQVEMHETARELKAELDSKISVLQTLVRKADERIATLSAAGERSQTTTSLEFASDEAAPKPAVIPPGAPGNDALRRSIYQLADRGWDARSIATEIERPIGDVELILSLRG